MVMVMAKFVIMGGKKLSGDIVVMGSKNAALPLLSAALLTKEPITLAEIPDIRDVENLLSIIEALGAKVARDHQAVTIEARTVEPSLLPEEKMRLLRGSILLMGALLGRCRHVTLPYPGGDIIGARPIDVHVDAFQQLGARITDDGKSIKIDGQFLSPGEVTLREFSVTATENVMLLAAQLPGRTTIQVAATEPHVVALGTLLNKMGAIVTGAGTHTIRIDGSSNLSGAKFTNIPDMLEAGLFILLGSVVGEDLMVRNAPVADLKLFFKKLDDIGVNYEIDASTNSVRVRPATLKSFRMQSLPFPGIPTDLQAPFAVVACSAHGSSLIHDPLYEDRFRHIGQLQKMGAKAVICDPHRVIIEGLVELQGRDLDSLDIRSGATLIMAGLAARGVTTIKGAEIVERGYANLESRLQAVGAQIRCEDERELAKKQLDGDYEKNRR